MASRLLGPVLDWPIEQGENPTCKGGCDKKGWSFDKYQTPYCAGCWKPSAGLLRYCEWCNRVWVAYGIVRVSNPPIPPRFLMHPACQNEFEGI